MRYLLATTAVIAAAALAGSAAASSPPHITVLSSAALPSGEHVAVDFDNPVASGFTFTQGSGAFVRSGALGLDPGVSAPPPGDLTNYETITAHRSATLTSSHLLSEVSFYLGSPDAYNWVRFDGPSYSFTLTGSALFDPITAFHGDQTVGRRVVYLFDGAGVNSVTFGSKGNSLEFDSVAVAVADAPEPATWALAIVGFASLGVALRRHRATQPKTVTA